MADLGSSDLAIILLVKVSLLHCAMQPIVLSSKLTKMAASAKFWTTSWCSTDCYHMWLTCSLISSCSNIWIQSTRRWSSRCKKEMTNISDLCMLLFQAWRHLQLGIPTRVLSNVVSAAEVTDSWNQRGSHSYLRITHQLWPLKGITQWWRSRLPKTWWRISEELWKAKAQVLILSIWMKLKISSRSRQMWEALKTSLMIK